MDGKPYPDTCGRGVSQAWLARFLRVANGHSQLANQKPCLFRYPTVRHSKYVPVPEPVALFFFRCKNFARRMINLFLQSEFLS